MDIATSKIVNSVGLVFDIVGVVLLFYFGAPTFAITDGQPAYYDRLGKLGLLLLIVGFILQFVSNFL